jgi:hypothetical protein
MKSFIALVVDDDPEILVQAKEAFPANPSSFLFTARSFKDALEIIRNEFLHAAFVDLVLDPRRAKNPDGLEILSTLAKLRPSCKRFLLTKDMMSTSSHRDAFFDLLNPAEPIIHGAIDKQNFDTNFADVLKDLCSQWLAGQVEVSDCAEVLAALTEKGVVEPESTRVTSEEIDYLVSRLLGQGKRRPNPTEDDVDRICLSYLSKGRSQSVVMLGRPCNRAGQQGIYCVIKVGWRSDAMQESYRYQTYVRFLMSLNRRVELLDFIQGDALGLVCYSFGGPSPESVCSLGDLFDREDFRAVNVIDELFPPESKEFYAREQKARDIGRFFSTTYGFNAGRARDAVDRFAERIAPAIGGYKEGNTLRVGGDALTLPMDVLGAGSFRTEYQACIIHGDLNAENVIVANDNRVICIDYRYTGWGPRTLDFAALQASVRLSSPVLARTVKEIVDDHRVEMEVWESAWSGKEGSEALPDSSPYWARVSHRLLRKLGENFADESPQAHASTCLLLALRLLYGRSWADEARLRLLVWMSSLTRFWREYQEKKQ